MLLLVLASPALAITVPDSRGAWTKAAVPIELRDRVHASAREVPGFPEDDPKLMQLKNWPKKRQIDGCDCELEVSTMIFDTDHPPPRESLLHRTNAYYQCRRRWWPWGRPELRGPFYSWALDGQLLERAYRRSRTDDVIYEVDRAGHLSGYLDRKHGTEEYFDADGVLIAGEYAPSNLDWRAEGYRGGAVSVWLGERITHSDFVKRRAQLFRDMASRY